MRDIKTIMVTGSDGFVGKPLVAQLKREGYDLFCVDYQQGMDVTKSTVFDPLDPVDLVIHLAAKLFVSDGFQDPAVMYETNIIGLLNVLEYCRKKNVRRMIYTSSYVYGTPQCLPIDENHPTQIQNPYGRSKLMGEMLCGAYWEDYGIGSVIFRPFNIYGPGQKNSFLIPSLIQQMLVSDTVHVKTLTSKRDFIFIDDVIEAYRSVISSFPDNQFDIFNLGTGKSYSVADVIEYLHAIIKKQTEVIVEEVKQKHEILECVADISKMRQYFNWSPQYSLNEGLTRTVEAYRNNV